MNHATRIAFMERMVREARKQFYRGVTDMEIYQWIENECYMNMIPATTRRDILETTFRIAKHQFLKGNEEKIERELAEESEIANKSTLTDVIESATPASLEEAIKEARQLESEKD